MSSIEGGGSSIPPDLKATYKNEFQRGLDLFQRSLSEYQGTEDGPKKDAFKIVMDEALQVMGETAKLALSKTGQKAESSVENDYQAYIADGSSDSLQKLQGDLDKLKKSAQ